MNIDGLITDKQACKQTPEMQINATNIFTVCTEIRSKLYGRGAIPPQQTLHAIYYSLWCWPADVQPGRRKMRPRKIDVEGELGGKELSDFSDERLLFIYFYENNHGAGSYRTNYVGYVFFCERGPRLVLIILISQ